MNSKNSKYVQQLVLQKYSFGVEATEPGLEFNAFQPIDAILFGRHLFIHRKHLSHQLISIFSISIF